MAGAVLLFIAAALLPAHIRAYPDYYVQEYGNGCTDHPTRGLGSHGPRVPDSDTTFLLKDPFGASATAVCPGARYYLTVTYATPRLALLTVAHGTLAGADASCPNRKVYNGDPVTAALAFWEVPCEPGNTQIKTTSAAGADRSFRFSDIKTQILEPSDPECTSFSTSCSSGGDPSTTAGAAVEVPLSPSTTTAPTLRAAPKVVWKGLEGVDKVTFQFLHALLMLAAFALLMPLGSLFARHKWMFGRDYDTGKVSVSWVYMHAGCQLLAVLCALVGFALALLAFGWREFPGDNMYAAHKWLGIVVLGMSVVQLLLSGFKPKLESKGRPHWNLLHWNWGRITMLAGAANTIIGAILVHDMKDQPYLFWLLPSCVTLGALLLLALLLEALKRQYERTHRYNPKTHEMRSVRDGWRVSRKRGGQQQQQGLGHGGLGQPYYPQQQQEGGVEKVAVVGDGEAGRGYSDGLPLRNKYGYGANGHADVGARGYDQERGV